MKKNLLFGALLLLVGISIALSFTVGMWHLLAIPLSFLAGYIWGTTNFKTDDDAVSN